MAKKQFVSGDFGPFPKPFPNPFPFTKESAVGGNSQVESNRWKFATGKRPQTYVAIGVMHRNGTAERGGVAPGAARVGGELYAKGGGVHDVMGYAEMTTAMC